MPTDSSTRRPPRIFINYRHADTQGTAWLLYMKLQERFGGENVFFDHGTLRPGMRWFEEIRSHLADSAVFIALIGAQWTKIMVDHEQQGGDDYVVKEIDQALRSRPQLTVIPVLVDESEIPNPDALPSSLRSLPECQAHTLRPTQLPDDISHLIDRLVEVSDGTPPPPPSPPRPPPQESAEETPPVGPPFAGDGRRQVEEHYRMVANRAGSLVVFLGSGANADDRMEPWQADLGVLPDDQDLARYLAARAGLMNSSPHLAEVAQYAGAHYCERDLFDWVTQAFRADSRPGPVHTYLAQLPAVLGKRYQLIVTPKYDAALEKAFRDAGEEFDMVVYMAPGSQRDGQFIPEGKFVHVPWDGRAQSIDRPNEYRGLPIVAEDCRLRRTIIVWIHGAADDQLPELQCEDNYVITEDHYISYMSCQAEEVVPAQLLAKLRKSNYLFLGYTIADWRLRVFLRRIWKGPGLGRAQYWAVEHDPDPLEEDLWRQMNVRLYRSSLDDYLRGFHDFLRRHQPLQP